MDQENTPNTPIADSLFKHDLIVIGSSSGGIETLRVLLGNLAKDLQASLLIVQHRMAHGNHGDLAKILGRKSPLPVREVADNESIEIGHVYIAPSDRHLLVEEGHTLLVWGPKENFVRPAIDVLFRSAAVSYGSRVIGVVLTGDMDDGSEGLRAIKRCGGIAVVQDPADALFSAMPANAKERGPADHVVGISDMATLLAELVKQPAPPIPSIPGDLRAEVRMIRNPYDILETMEQPRWTPYTCPECGGVLRQMPDADPPRFRCHVGHAFTEQSLLTDQSAATERALWAAIRALEERAALLRKMASYSREQSRDKSAAEYESQSAESAAYAEHIRQWFSAEN